MKKLIYFILCLVCLPVASWLTSCGDNENFSAPHVMTPDEIMEKRRQDSIDSVARTIINADLVLTYKVSDVTTPDGIWTNKKCVVDLEAVGEVFGMTAQEVANGIINGTVKGCAMDAQTHAMSETASTSNGLIGHWWTSSGSIGTWANDLANLVCYAEWQCWELGEDGNANLDECYYSIGQFPGRLYEGFEVTIYEGMKYDDKRVIFEIKYRIPDPTKSTVVAEENVNISLPANPKGYTLHPFEFNSAAMYRELELDTITDNNIIAIAPDGSYTQNLTADHGFWYLKEGPVGGFSDDVSCEIVYPGTPQVWNTIGVCLKPKKTQAGDVYKHDFGFFNDGNIYMLHVTVNVTEPE